ASVYVGGEQLTLAVAVLVRLRFMSLLRFCGAGARSAFGTLRRVTACSFVALPPLTLTLTLRCSGDELALRASVLACNAGELPACNAGGLLGCGATAGVPKACCTGSSL